MDGRTGGEVAELDFKLEMLSVRLVEEFEAFTGTGACV